MNFDLIKKINYMLNMESGANFEYLASVAEKSGNDSECAAYLYWAQEKYNVAKDNAVQEKEIEDASKAVKRVMDRIVSTRVNVR